MQKFINLDEPKESNPQFLLMSILQFSYFALMNAIVWGGKLYGILPLLVFYYLISLSLKILIWIVVSRTLNSDIKVTKADFLLFIFLIDFKEAYRFDRFKQIKIKYFWMVIYNLQCMSSYIFLFIFLQDSFATEINFDFISDIYYIKLIMFLTSIYIIIGMIFGNYMLIIYLSINPQYKISYLRKFILAIFIFSKIFTYIYLLIQAMDQLIVGCFALGFRIIFIVFYSYYVSKNNKCARFRLSQLIPFLPVERLIQLIRNLLRGYLIYGMNVDIFPIMLKVSNVYDRMVVQTSFLVIRLINTLEIIALFVYGYFFRDICITQIQFFNVAFIIIIVYLGFNTLYFISQIIMKIKNSFPSYSLDTLPDIDQNEKDEVINANINTSLLQSTRDNSQIYIQQVLYNSDSKFLIQLELYSNQEELDQSRNQQKLIQILEAVWQNLFRKNLMLIVDDQLMIDINQNKCYLYLTNKNINYISYSLIECSHIQNKSIIFIFKEKIEPIHLFQVQKAVVKHLQSIKLIQFDSHYTNKEVDEALFKSILPFYSFYLQDFLQISSFYKIISPSQIYNPFHILYDLYEDM